LAGEVAVSRGHRLCHPLRGGGAAIWAASVCGRRGSEMQEAGITRVGGPVEIIDVREPRPLAGDEVLVEVRAAGGR